MGKTAKVKKKDDDDAALAEYMAISSAEAALQKKSEKPSKPNTTDRQALLQKLAAQRDAARHGRRVVTGFCDQMSQKFIDRYSPRQSVINYHLQGSIWFTIWFIINFKPSPCFLSKRQTEPTNVHRNIRIWISAYRFRYLVPPPP